MSNQSYWENVSTTLSHPRLFFKAADIPILEAKSKTPPCRALWERILRGCEKSDNIPSLSLAYLVTGDMGFANRAKTNIWNILDEPKRWDEPEFLAVNHRLMEGAYKSCGNFYSAAPSF